MVEHLVERSATLKQELVAFLRDRRVSREFDEALEERYGGLVTGDQDDLVLFFDRFLLEHRLRDGRTPVERFVRARGELPRAERDMMLGWTGVIESVFEVGDFDGKAAQLTNLVDELPYQVWSNMGAAGFEQLRPGMIAAVRLVPVLDQWLISGPGMVLPPEEAEPLLRIAAQRAATHPEALCRNEAHHETARRMQRKGREKFIAHFGSDLVTVTGAELERRAAEFWAASGAGAVADQRLPRRLTAARSVGVFYDEVEGLGFYENFGDVWAPSWTRRRRRRRWRWSGSIWRTRTPRRCRYCGACATTRTGRTPCSRRPWGAPDSPGRTTVTCSCVGTRQATSTSRRASGSVWCPSD